MNSPKITKKWKAYQLKSDRGLRPSQTVQTFMFSTPSRFVGEYEANGILITHAFRSGTGSYHHEMQGPFSRSYYILSFSVPDRPPGQMFSPQYSSEFFLVCLSVLFGKRFDDNGQLQSHGVYRLPDIAMHSPLTNGQESFHNHTPRVNISVPLNLEHFSIMSSMLTEEGNDNIINTFAAAGRFYLQALRAADSDPESAYLNLITCGEILSNFYTYTDDQLYDPALLGQFAQIEKHVPEGDKLVSSLRSRLYQVKRKFYHSLMGLLTEEFSLRNELSNGVTFGAITAESIEKALKAAYDLRSAYVHTGRSFGRYIEGQNEIPFTTWVHGDPGLKDFLKIINTALTLKGLERVMRFCLLRFLETNGVITLPEFAQADQTGEAPQTPDVQ